MAAPKLGSGARFKALSNTLAAHGAHDPNALAASIGRKKLGAARMQKLAAAGRARHEKARTKPSDSGAGTDNSAGGQ